MTFSALKSLLLIGADTLTAAVSGPAPFTRGARPDPSAAFRDDYERRGAIAVGAERELEAFVREGVFVAQKPNDLGDAAIWQGVYAGMTALRWRVLGTSEAYLAMGAAAQALARYLDGGVLHRGAVPRGLEGELFHRDPTKVYYDVDGVVYRDDASLDSLLGLCFGAALLKRWGDTCAQDALRGPLLHFSARFQNDGYRLVRRDGSPTTYGDCRPGVFQAPVRVLAAVLPGMLAGGDAWRELARAHAPEFATTDTQVPGRVSYVNAHLALLANLAYVAGAPLDAPGLKEAADGVRRLVAKYADAGNALAVTGARALGLAVTISQQDKADKVLLEFPVGAKPKSAVGPAAPAAQPVPVWQRPPADIIWQRSPYTQSGAEAAEYTRLDYLLAHYLSRSSR